MSRENIATQKIAVVMPLLNEADVIESLVDQVAASFEFIGCQWTVVLVNDGSTDGSGKILDQMAATDRRISVVHLSRNFGHQAALHAGLSHVDADAVIVMDSDAQDDPAAIPAMIAHWQEGFDVVYAVRFGRKESALKRLAFHTFHRLMKSLASVDIPADAGNFGLMDAAVVEQIRQLGETDRYFPGLRTWVGFRQCALSVERLKRYDDSPRVKISGLISLAKTALLSFSRVPLLAFYGLAILSAVIGTCCFSWAMYHRLVTGEAIPGWASITSLSAFFGTINALGIAVLGEYVTRIYDQVRNRPSFVVAKTRNLSAGHLDVSSAIKPELELIAQVEELQRELQRVSADRTEDATRPAVSEQR